MRKPVTVRKVESVEKVGHYEVVVIDGDWHRHAVH